MHDPLWLECWMALYEQAREAEFENDRAEAFADANAGDLFKMKLREERKCV